MFGLHVLRKYVHKVKVKVKYRQYESSGVNQKYRTTRFTTAISSPGAATMLLSAVLLLTCN